MKLYATGGRDLMQFTEGKSHHDNWSFSPDPGVSPTTIWEWMEYYDQDEAHLVEITLPHSDESLAPYRFEDATIGSPQRGWRLPVAMAVGHPLRITTYQRRHSVWRKRGYWDGPIDTPLPSPDPLGGSDRSES